MDEAPVIIKEENVVVDECVEKDTSKDADVQQQSTNTEPSDCATSNTNEEQKEDENINREDTEDVHVKEDENVEAEENSVIVVEKIDNMENKEVTVIDLTDDVQNDSSSVKNLQGLIHFTGDINLEQQKEQREENDEDVLNELNDIETIVLGADFEAQDEPQPLQGTSKDQVPNSGNVEKNETIKNTTGKEKLRIVKTEDLQERVQLIQEYVNNEWYEEKLAEKEAIIKERLAKVAKVLGISYPCYEPWLEYEEKVNGTPLCKLRSPRRCCLKKPYTNRWKFMCVRKKKVDSMVQTKEVWKLEPNGAWGVNIQEDTQFPPFILCVVKIFEDFLQTTIQHSSSNSASENFSEDISIDVESKKETIVEGRQDWLSLVVRCNSMDELMLFATGKNITRSTMERLKQIYEFGPGKHCNVKSLYCKSINKCDNSSVTDTTFLVGSEALDETVGGLKVQLAPKTNFWSNTAGAENVANTVMDFITPNPKITILEIGCGIGLIGLMMASKCQNVIGVDSQSEVEEAELTCELNNIKNASFIVGTPFEVTPRIIAAVKNHKTHAIINANTNIGRAIEVMTCLRKIQSIRRIVMITTLTKQSVRAILELARPGDRTHGPPFLPIVACVVDTLPIGAHFEAVILLQRRQINKNNQLWYQKAIEENVKSPDVKIIQEKIANEQNTIEDKRIPNNAIELQMKKNINKPTVKIPVNQFTAKKQSKIAVKKAPFVKNIDNVPAKNKFRGKRSHSPDMGEASSQKLKKFNKFDGKPKPWFAVQDQTVAKKKKDWNPQNSELRINPMFGKGIRENKEQIDLRERLSNNRVDTDIAQQVKEHQVLLEIAKEKLNGPSPTVDVNTAKQLQNMLNMVLEQTNKLQSQLPRSVWDRIAPPENASPDQGVCDQDDSPLKGRFVQEMGSQDIVITTPNKEFLNTEEQKPVFKKYHNLMPLAPDIMPVTKKNKPLREPKAFHPTPERFRESNVRHQPRQQPIQEAPWVRNKNFEGNRWNEKSFSPVRRQPSPTKVDISPVRNLSPSRRPYSPGKVQFSILDRLRQMSPTFRQRSPVRRQMSPPRRQMSPRRMSPSRRQMSPRRMSPININEMMMNRSLSPMRRQISPTGRQISPMRRQMSPIRRQMSPRRQSSPIRRQQIPSPNRMVSPNRSEILLPRRQGMPQERQQRLPIMVFDRQPSPKRQQSPPRRQISPQRFADEWDIPSRRAVEQNTWAHSVEQNMWHIDKQGAGNNWEQNDRRRKPPNQDKWEKNQPIRNDNWNSGANDWDNSTQMGPKPMMKEQWLSNTDRWSSNMPGPSNENRNIRGKESFNPGKESWMEKNKQNKWNPFNVKDSWIPSDIDDFDDLPEDARDPWGDEGTSDLKERWQSSEGAASSTWTRENESKRDTWVKHNKDNWGNKGVNKDNWGKNTWQNNNVQNSGEPRWILQGDLEKKGSSSGWKSGNNPGSWKFQNQNFQSQRPYLSQFKGL